jgi:fluoroquinolone transport system ATP-binding protein
MIVDVRNLRFRYPGAEAPVLKGLNFSIGEGEIFGFLGPNGSGKTTTQKLLVRILFGYEGEVEVFGRDLRSVTPDYFNRVGVCFESPNLYAKLTAEENLDFYRSFFAVPTDGARDILERFDLPVGDRRRAGQFSKGMQLRLALARSVLNRPDLLFLDEPTSGQDPQHAVAIRELIRELASAGTTVFLTTHNMTLAHELCDRVALLSDGEIVVTDSPQSLTRAHAKTVARVEYRVNGELASRDFDLEDETQKAAFVQVVQAYTVETIHTHEPTLEDVFIRETGRRLE